jgi:uncharacterized membrane protein
MGVVRLSRGKVVEMVPIGDVVMVVAAVWVGVRLIVGFGPG